MQASMFLIEERIKSNNAREAAHRKKLTRGCDSEHTHMSGYPARRIAPVTHDTGTGGIHRLEGYSVQETRRQAQEEERRVWEEKLWQAEREKVAFQERIQLLGR
jgi:hypothetical protein